jgi:hypothetical protein
MAAEFDVYMAEMRMPGLDDPLDWWAANKVHFPLLSSAARKYLSPPPSSVESERAFSMAGLVGDDRRSRLLPDHFENLVFLKCNMLLMNF